MNPHPSADELVVYARSSASMPPVRAASVEQHLLACGACRRSVADASSTVWLDESWSRVADVIDRPPRRALARPFDRLLPDLYVRPVTATAGLRWSWLTATTALIVGAAVLDRMADTDRFVLLLAPLVAVAIVVVTFAPAGEPGGEASYAAPAFGLGLILRRVVAALIPALIAVGLAATLVSSVGAGALVWLLPALALAAVTLALATWASVPVAGAIAASVWMVAVALTGPSNPFVVVRRWQDVDLFDPRGQLVAISVLVAAVIVLSLRKEHIATPEVSW